MQGKNGNDSLKGEFESATLIDARCPGVCPNPIAWGTFKLVSDHHYCIFTFYDLQDHLPDIDYLCEQLSVLHSNLSPNGKFGFHVTTYNGNLPQKNDWCDSWEDFFTAGLKHVLSLREDRAGPCTELDELLPSLFEQVIPRLLHPLETDGRKIKPVLVHGDLWCGNTAAVKDSPGRGVVWNPASFYAHKECEYRNSNVQRYQGSRLQTSSETGDQSVMDSPRRTLNSIRRSQAWARALPRKTFGIATLCIAC